MFLKYFTNPNSLNYNMSEIFDQDITKFLIPTMHYTSIITIFFSLILIIIIIFKTPKQMKFFKTYLLPYVFNTLLLEIVMLIFKPLLLHPFFAVVSLEMPETGSPKILLILFIFMAYFAMALIDCIAGMAAERYFALTNLNSNHSRKPIIIFSVLSFSSLGFLILSVILICFDSIRHAFIMPSTEANIFLNLHLKNFNQFYAIKSILVFRTDISLSNFTIGFTLFVLFVFSRYLIALIFFVLSAIKSHSSMIGMSRTLRKHNSMLLRCTYAQFCGFCIFAGFPAIVIVLIYYFYSEPNKIIYLCFALMNTFGLFDILITVICIKPYRNFFLDLIHLDCFCFKVSPQRKYGRQPSINVINIINRRTTLKNPF